MNTSKFYPRSIVKFWFLLNKNSTNFSKQTSSHSFSWLDSIQFIVKVWVAAHKINEEEALVTKQCSCAMRTVLIYVWHRIEQIPINILLSTFYNLFSLEKENNKNLFLSHNIKHVGRLSWRCHSSGGTPPTKRQNKIPQTINPGFLHFCPDEIAWCLRLS